MCHTQILEQNVEVIKVILQEQCQQMRFFFFESVWRGGCGQHGKSVLPHSLPHTRIRRAKDVVLELFGPVAPDTFRRWHDGGAPDLRGRPPVELPPFAFSRLANLSYAVAARLSLSVHTWQHVYRHVLRELDIEFEPSSQAAIMEARGDLHPPQAE